jgi:Putative beta-barrel porin-2, OmpL-like. bbp2
MKLYKLTLLLLTLLLTKAQHICAQEALNDSLKQWNITFSLNADGYYRFSPSRTGSFSSPVFRHHSPRLNWINPRIELAYKNDLKLVADMAYGDRQYAFYAYIDTTWNSYFKELYIEYTFGDRLHAAAGAYTTHFNFEYNEPGQNNIYTPSFIYTYIPASYSGPRLTYDLTENWSIMAGAYNDFGANRFHFGKIRHLAAALAYVSDTANLSFNFITGRDYAVSDVMSIELYGDKYLAKKFNLGIDLQYYRGKNEGEIVATSWSAVALYPKYELNDHWQLGARTEWFFDKKGFAFGTQDNVMQGYTLCAKYFLTKLHSQLVAEYRFDNATKPIFDHFDTKNPLRRRQTGLTLATIVQF